MSADVHEQLMNCAFAYLIDGPWAWARVVRPCLKILVSEASAPLRKELY